MKNIVLTLLLPFLLFSPVHAGSSLFFGEIQAVAGYSSMDDKVIYRSGHAQDPMQKNSVGFDLIKKFSSQTRDILTAALQLRVAYDDNEEKAQLQVYNAYLKAKTFFADIYIGHSRTAFGLESYWDTHGELIQPLQMYGFGYDRDWGIVFSKDTANGNVQFALTSGTGMTLRFKDNWLITSRISKGVLSYDNYTLGLSVMAGNVLETMGYSIMSEEISELGFASADFAYNHNNFEHKAQINAGKITDDAAFAGLYRISLNFLEENKLKLEGQYVYTRREDSDNHYIDAQISYKINSDITARLAYGWQREMNDSKIVAQFYYYFLI
ncbi:MAG: hypothetical protein LBL00_06460 [Endomicrobium sp.]|jgi:hypothetical protein|nr:hypothetical protein [Endomicrobium sp.]